MKGLFFGVLIAVVLAGTTAASAIEWQKFNCDDPAWKAPPFSPAYCKALSDYQEALKLNEKVADKTEEILKLLDQRIKEQIKRH